MVSNNKKLGKGLEKLFGQDLEKTIREIEISESSDKIFVKINLIQTNPYQPRIFFNEEKIGELAKSIEEHGIFTPILLKKTLDNRYYIIAGERRYRAAKKIGLSEVPAIILDIDDKKMMEISLIENIQRENLNIIEEAKAYSTMMHKLNLTQEKLASSIGKKRSYIANVIRVLNLPTEIKKMIETEKLTFGHIKPIMGLNNPELMLKIAKKAYEKKQTVREVEQVVQGYKLLGLRLNKDQDNLVDNELKLLSRQISRKLKFKTKISKNQIIIDFKEKNKLNELLTKLNLIEEYYGD